MPKIGQAAKTATIAAKGLIGHKQILRWREGRTNKARQKLAMREPNGQSEPLLNLPAVVAVLIVGMATLHGVREFVLSPQTDFWLLLQLAFVPARLSGWLDPAGGESFFNQLRSGLGAGQAQMVRLLMAEGEARLWTLLTYG
ncbi:MAG: hypothetical protein ACRDBH_08010, partial [Bosea sp. (in: a-proteobacteria)]